MMQTTFGIEEEYLLLDAKTGRPANRVEELVELVPELGDRAEHEFLSSQLETATHICTSADEALQSLTEFRRTVGQAAASLGVVVAGTGLPPVGRNEGVVMSTHKRYQTLGEEMREVARDLFVTGTHVHVRIPSPDAGVAALQRLARWAPVLLAMTANSPIWQGNETGFASWRHMKGLSWPVAGYPPEFRNGNDYARSIDLMIGSGLVLDAGAVSWVARLSHNYPTLELRIADAQLRADDAVAFAIIVRALIMRVLEDHERGMPKLDYPRGLVDGSLWLAARNGLEANLLDPATGLTSFAFDTLDHMMHYIRPQLERMGDLERAEAYVEHLHVHGSPAQQQRDIFAEHGIEGLLDLYAAGTAQPATEGAL